MAISGKWKEIKHLYNRSIQLEHMVARVMLDNPATPVAIINPASEIHVGGIGSEAIHGGVLAALAALTALALGLLRLHHYCEGMTATAQLTVHYLKPFRTKAIIAAAHSQQVVGNRIFGTVELTNNKDEVCAIAYGALAKGISM